MFYESVSVKLREMTTPIRIGSSKAASHVEIFYARWPNSKFGMYCYRQWFLKKIESTVVLGEATGVENDEYYSADT